MRDSLNSGIFEHSYGLIKNFFYTYMKKPAAVYVSYFQGEN